MTHNIHIAVSVKIGGPNVERISRNGFRTAKRWQVQPTDWLMRLAIDDQLAPKALGQAEIMPHQERLADITSCLKDKVRGECGNNTLANHLPASFGHTSLPIPTLVAN